jgi:NAD(P)-dependent dehydrogenase (short-subunit alcohol dehydrogenase family)
MKVKGKVCVVTGAAGGIGEAVARRYAKEGAKGVVVADMDAGRLEKVAKDIGGLAVAGDIGKEAEVKKLVAEAEKNARLDGLGALWRHQACRRGAGRASGDPVRR